MYFVECVKYRGVSLGRFCIYVDTGYQKGTEIILIVKRNTLRQQRCSLSGNLVNKAFFFVFFSFLNNQKIGTD